MSMPLNTLELLNAKSFLDLIRSPWTKITFSQFGEDVIVFDILLYNVKKIHGGFFVDVGAYHPNFLSNTRLLKILGWTGINIDANEDVISMFNAERPDDINICCGVGASEGNVVYHCFESGAINTFNPIDAENQIRKGQKLIEKKVIKVRPINQILEERLPKNQKIDYMNIDLEGSDRDVIAALNFAKYRPSIISIELFDVDLLNLNNDKTVSLLVTNGYILFSITKFTFIFLDSVFKE